MHTRCSAEHTRGVASHLQLAAEIANVKLLIQKLYSRESGCAQKHILIRHLSFIVHRRKPLVCCYFRRKHKV